MISQRDNSFTFFAHLISPRRILAYYVGTALAYWAPLLAVKANFRQMDGMAEAVYKICC